VNHIKNSVYNMTNDGVRWWRSSNFTAFGWNPFTCHLLQNITTFSEPILYAELLIDIHVTIQLQLCDNKYY